MPGLRLRNPKDKGDNGTEILGPLRVWGHPTRPPQTPEVLLSAAEQDTGCEVLEEDIQHPTIPPWATARDRRGRWSLADANFPALNQNISTRVLGGPSRGLCGRTPP